MGGVAKAVGKAVGGVAKAAGKVVKAVAKNPVAIVSVVVAPQLAPIIAKSLGVKAVAASAISNAVVSGAVTLAKGGDLGDILKSSAAAGFGTYVGGAVGTKVASEFGNVAGKVSAAAAGNFTGTLIATGGDVKAALEQGVMGGATAGLQAGISSGLETIKQKFPGTLTTGEGTTSAQGQVGQKIPTSPFGTYETVAPTSPFGTYGTTSMPNLKYEPSFTQKGLTASEPAVTKLAENALAPTLASALGFGGQPTTQSTGPAPSTSGPGVAVTGDATQQVSPAAANALAQALRVGDPGAPLFGSENQGQQQGVWNTASLKFKDEFGG
jgi:hypothetical protein